MSGVFITFEGGEGTGKTTQIALLRDYLEARGHAVVVTREPGGAPIAEAIRTILLDPAHAAMCPVAELLLYEAARAQHVAELIRPALEAGKTVLSDRFADSTTVYQGAGRGLPSDAVRGLHEIATAGVWPSLTIVFDLPVEEGLRRAGLPGVADRIERESLAFHQRVRDGFLHLAEQEPRRVHVVDAARPIDTIAGDVRVLVERALEVS